MTVTAIGRWTTPNAAASTELARRAKAIWLKHGAQDVRLSQIFTGPFTGQFIVATVYADMAAFAKVFTSAMASPDMQQIAAENAKVGAVMQEREILVGIDI